MLKGFKLIAIFSCLVFTSVFAYKVKAEVILSHDYSATSTINYSSITTSSYPYGGVQWWSFKTRPTQLTVPRIDWMTGSPIPNSDIYFHLEVRTQRSTSTGLICSSASSTVSGANTFQPFYFTGCNVSTSTEYWVNLVLDTNSTTNTGIAYTTDNSNETTRYINTTLQTNDVRFKIYGEIPDCEQCEECEVCQECESTLCYTTDDLDDGAVINFLGGLWKPIFIFGIIVGVLFAMRSYIRRFLNF